MQLPNSGLVIKYISIPVRSSDVQPGSGKLLSGHGKEILRRRALHPLIRALRLAYKMPTIEYPLDIRHDDALDFPPKSLAEAHLERSNPSVQRPSVPLVDILADAKINIPSGSIDDLYREEFIDIYEATDDILRRRYVEILRKLGKNDEFFTLLRKRMVARLRAGGKTEEVVLQALNEVPHELFFPVEDQHLAYARHSTSIEIGQQRTTFPPTWVMVYIAQVLSTAVKKKILVTGSGAGYLAAVLNHLGREVHLIGLSGIQTDIEDRAFSSLSVKNVSTYLGDGLAGLPDKAPFEGIIVLASFGDAKALSRLGQQLDSGGILITAKIDLPEKQKLVVSLKLPEGSNPRYEAARSPFYVNFPAWAA